MATSNSNIHSVMNSIDNIKSKLTDAEYKEVCDGMLKLNKEMAVISKSKEHIQYYEVSYIDTRIENVNDDEFDIEHKVKKTIVKFREPFHAEMVENWKRDIDLFGSVRLCTDHFTGIDDVKRVNVRYDKNCCCEIDCDCDRDYDYKTISLIYRALTVIRIKDL